MRIFFFCIFSGAFAMFFANEEVVAKASTTPIENVAKPVVPLPFEPFTGKVVAHKVRLRTQGDLQSPIVRELFKNECLLVLGEQNDFYKVAIPSDVKLYVFSLYVKNNTVEANRVNIRLKPSLESPIVGQLQQAEKVEGSPLMDAPKWMEILPPQNIHFYVSKEYIEKSGSPEIFALFEKRKSESHKLLDSANLLTQEEFKKSKETQSFTSIIPLYESLIKEFSDFSDIAAQAKEQLAKIAQSTIETTPAQKTQPTSVITPQETQPLESIQKDANEPFSKMFQALEEEIFLSWNSFHPAKTQKDFYEEQMLNSQVITGTVEALEIDVKNAPGNFVLKSDGKLVGYLYSTTIELNNSLGKKIELTVSSRPNNNFAYPAYFVHEIH